MVTRSASVGSPTFEDNCLLENEHLITCFICDEVVESIKTSILMDTKLNIPNKLSQLVGEEYTVIISDEDYLCEMCNELIKRLDQLQICINDIVRTLSNHLNKKYGLTEETNTQMSIEKVSKWYNYCTEVCYLSYIKNQEKIGGQDEIVEIGNIILSSNKTVGNMIIFGGIARNTKKCFAVNVKSTSKEDILQKLVHNVLPGSKIISSYSFFKELKNLGYSSESVNNCPRSVSPKNPSIHILNLFRMWRSLKQVYDRGLTDLCLYTFLYFNKKKLLLASERFLPFLKDISDLYPVYKVEKFMVEE